MTDRPVSADDWSFCPECEHPRGACICEEYGEDDEIGGADDWDGEGLEGDDDLSNCHMFEDGGVFVCGAVGSEDCDECPFHDDLGKTVSQVEREMEESGD